MAQKDVRLENPDGKIVVVPKEVVEKQGLLNHGFKKVDNDKASQKLEKKAETDEVGEVPEGEGATEDQASDEDNKEAKGGKIGQVFNKNKKSQ